MSTKSRAYEFLQGYEESLRTMMSSTNIEDQLKNSNLKRQEDAVVAEYFFPCLQDHCLAKLDVTEEYLGNSLSLESYVKYSDRFPSANHPPKRSGARTTRHPFPKDLSVDSKSLYNRWISGEAGKATQETWPDFGLQVPGGLNILFEAKLYRNNATNAESSLAQGLYEANYYRGLPNSYSADGTLKWKSCDFSCFIACDASKNNRMLTAYERIPTEVKTSFWESAGIYVLIIPSAHIF